jgi:excisionase family DNA binding protein
MPTPYLSTMQTADLIGLSKQTIVALAKSGDLPAYFVANRWRFKAEDIEAFVASQRRSH